VVQQAILNKIATIFEPKFLDCSYGFRPNRSTHQAISKVDEYLGKGNQWVVEVDIEKYFDTVEQEKLIDFVAEEIADGRVLKLIRKFLQSGVMEEKEIKYHTTGTPQGGVVSPLLANIYLHKFDGRMLEQGYKVIRYADDILIMCQSEGEAEEALKLAKEILEGELRLKVNPEKTKTTNRSRGFEFLGYNFLLMVLVRQKLL
jgi:group II intron reverse transcriptase/maturase